MLLSAFRTARLHLVSLVLVGSLFVAACAAAPVLTSMSGCSGVDSRPNVQSNCTAGTLLTLHGSGFTPNLSSIVGLAVHSQYVPVDIVSSADTEVVIRVPEPTEDSAGTAEHLHYVYIESECQYAEGLWQHFWYAAADTATLSNPILARLSRAQHRHPTRRTPPATAQAYFPFPTITSISGCSDAGNVTANCSAGSRVLISGGGFGCSNAVVYFSGGGSGYYCSDVQAVSGREGLTCTLPAVAGEYAGPFALSVYTHNMWSNVASLLWYGQHGARNGTRR